MNPECTKRKDPNLQMKNQWIKANMSVVNTDFIEAIAIDTQHSYKKYCVFAELNNGKRYLIDIFGNYDGAKDFVDSLFIS